ncbi:MAG: hypothetical protein IJH92_03240 [Mogibacterium sp.]|nr:hypothetical protein [Mogibacterium sp.]
MEFKIPEYKAPDFTAAKLANAPDCRFEEADRDGVAPEYFHSTSMVPEYFKVNGEWKLAEESRMDSSVFMVYLSFPYWSEDGIRTWHHELHVV